MNEFKKDSLAGLFVRLPQEKLSSSFREEMMRQIRREEIRIKKRNRMWTWIGVVSAIVCLVVAAGYAVLNIQWEEFRIPVITWTPASSFFVYFSVLVGVLLAMDHLLRKHYREKHREDIKESR